MSKRKRIELTNAQWLAESDFATWSINRGFKWSPEEVVELRRMQAAGETPEDPLLAAFWMIHAIEYPRTGEEVRAAQLGARMAASSDPEEVGDRLTDRLREIASKLEPGDQPSSPAQAFAQWLFGAPEK